MDHIEGRKLFFPLFFILPAIRDYRPAVLETPSSFVLLDSFRFDKLCIKRVTIQYILYKYTLSLFLSLLLYFWTWVCVEYSPLGSRFGLGYCSWLFPPFDMSLSPQWRLSLSFFYLFVSVLTSVSFKRRILRINAIVIVHRIVCTVQVKSCHHDK